MTDVPLAWHVAIGAAVAAAIIQIGRKRGVFPGFSGWGVDGRAAPQGHAVWVARFHVNLPAWYALSLPFSEE
jgi:hypothetical protein